MKLVNTPNYRTISPHTPKTAIPRCYPFLISMIVGILGCYYLFCCLYALEMVYFFDGSVEDMAGIVVVLQQGARYAFLFMRTFCFGMYLFSLEFY